MRHSGLPLAIAGSHTSTHTLPEHHRAQNADHLAHNTPFSAFFTKVVCDLGATPPQVAASPSPIGGIARHEPPTRRRHAARRRRVVQNPHDRRCGGRRRIRRVAVPGCGARGQQRGLAGLRGDAPSEARGADDSRTGRRPRAHKAAQPKQQCEGRCTRYGPLHPLRAAAPVTGRYTRSEGVHCLRIGCSTPNHKNKRGICETRAWLRHPWEAGPGRASKRRAERSSQRGRLADGPPPTGVQSSPALSRSSADTPRRAVAAIRDGDAGSGQAVA